VRALLAPSRAAFVGGLAIAVLAVGWWWVTYRDVIAYDYMPPTEAALCLVADTAVCRLARSLCRSDHPLALVDYSSLSIWFAVGLTSLGLFSGPRAR
jgi:hypothetical protein